MLAQVGELGPVHPQTVQLQQAWVMPLARWRESETGTALALVGTARRKGGARQLVPGAGGVVCGRCALSECAARLEAPSGVCAKSRERHAAPC